MYKHLRSRLLASTVIYGALAALPAALGTMALTSPAMADAYTSVDVTGMVTDSSNQAVAGANVTLISPQGTRYHITSNKNGQFSVNQIPAGHYSVAISAAGMKPFHSSLNTGIGSSSFGFTLQPMNSLETVVVTGSGTKALANFQSTSVGLSVDVGQMSTEIPVDRSVIAAVEMAPGVGATAGSLDSSTRRHGQTTASLGGASGAESVYYINGLNVTDQRTLMGYAELPYDMVATVDTKTGGFNAEFGRATGGVVNITSKSGSNDWHFGGGAYWEPNAMRANRGTMYGAGDDGSAGSEYYYQNSKTNQNEESFWLSGPLLKDHIFMFANINPQQYSSRGAATYLSSTATSGTETYSKSNSPKWGAKFDFVLNENQRIEYTIFSDKAKTYYTPYRVTGREDSVITASDATNADGSMLSYWEKSGGINHIVKYTGRFTDWFTLSALYGRIESNYTDGGAGAKQPSVYDYSTGGYATTATEGSYDTDGHDIRNTYRVDADFYFSAYGDHHIRIGYDRENMTSKTNESYGGGAEYFGYTQSECSDNGVTSDSNGCIMEKDRAHAGTYKATQAAYYFQDAWQILPTLSLNLGVRNDLYNYKNGDGQSYIKTHKQWAPRVGFSWDPFENGTDKVYGSFGDYYLPIAMNTSIREVSGETYTETYYATKRDNTGALVINDDGTPTLGDQLSSVDYLSPPGVPDPRTVTAKGLDPMYEREIILGYEHNFHGGLLDDWTMSVRWSHRQLMSTIEDTAIGDAVARWCVRTGTSCEVQDGTSTYNAATDMADYSSYLPYVLINPGKAADVYVDLQGDSSTSANYNPQWVHLTKADLDLPKAKRHYNAITFSFNRPFDGTWGLQGSYTWSESVGNYEGSVKSDIGQTDAGLTQDFDHESIMIGTYGELPNAHKHQIKIYGTYSPLPGLITGLSFIAKSGRPYGCIGYAPSSEYEDAQTSATPASWFCPWGSQTSSSTSLDAQQEALGGATGTYNSVLVGRGAYKMPWTFTFNLHTAYTYATDDYGAYTLSFDVFNLFDANRKIAVVEQGEVTNYPGVRDANWGKAYERQSPRYVRIGISFEY